VEVIDNFLSEEDFIEVEKLLMGANFAWHFNNLVVYGDDEESVPKEDNFQFTHAFYTPDIEAGYEAVNSQHFPVLFPILKKLPIKALWRVKSNMMPKQDKHIVHEYHKDVPSKDFKSTTAIFYVNTNNGYTIFKDGTKVDSVANRLVSFDSQKLHSGSTCTDTKSRVVININYF